MIDGKVVQMKIEFELGKGSGHPHVPVYVNGAGPFTFTLDTGAAKTTISKSMVEKLGIETYTTECAKATGVGGGMIDVEFATLDKLQIGSEVLENEEVAIMDFESIFGPGLCFTPGVLGHTSLKDYRMSVNYRTKVLELDKSNGSNLTQDVDWIDFRYEEDTHLVAVPVYVNGKGPYDFTLDTGSGGDVLTPKLAKELGLKQDDSMGIMKVVSPGSQGCADGCQGIGGTVTGYPVQVNSLSIGPITHHNVIMGVIDLKVISPRGKDIQNGIIGYPFMKDLELIIDYPKQKFAFIQ
jgi:predicted aspartyl protease